jgi:hypothetical protein
MRTDTPDSESDNTPLPICFETNRLKKWGTKLAALCFFVLTLSILGCLGVCCFVVAPFALPLAMLVVCTAALLFFFAAYYHRRILPGLQFCVIFRRDHLQLGRAFAKQLLQYDEIDRIHATPNAGVRVGCGKKTAIVFLDWKEEPDCVTLLRQRCPNAYFVDEWGCEHLPIAPTCPETTLAGVEQHHRALAWGYVLLSCSFAWCVLRLWVLGWDLLVFGALALVCICACPGAAWRSWQIARLARRNRIEASASGGVASKADNCDVSNDNRDFIANPSP